MLKAHSALWETNENKNLRQTSNIDQTSSFFLEINIFKANFLDLEQYVCLNQCFLLLVKGDNLFLESNF